MQQKGEAAKTRLVASSFLTGRNCEGVCLACCRNKIDNSLIQPGELSQWLSRDDSTINIVIPTHSY